MDLETHIISFMPKWDCIWNRNNYKRCWNHLHYQKNCPPFIFCCQSVGFWDKEDSLVSWWNINNVSSQVESIHKMWRGNKQGLHYLYFHNSHNLFWYEIFFYLFIYIGQNTSGKEQSTANLQPMQRAWTVLAISKQYNTNTIPGLQYCNTVPYQ